MKIMGVVNLFVDIIVLLVVLSMIWKSILVDGIYWSLVKTGEFAFTAQEPVDTLKHSVEVSVMMAA